MASLSEMLQTGMTLNELKNQSSGNGQLAQILNSALTGYSEGRALATKDKAVAFDRILKTLSAQKTIGEIEQQAQNAKITSNFAKRMGLLDLSPAEASNARTVAFDSLGGGTPPPVDHTAQGKMSGTYQAALKPDNNLGWKFNSKNGLTFWDKSSTKDKEKDPAATMEKVRDAAIAAARREKFNTISSIVGPDEAQKYSNVEPTEDEVQKYIPEYQAYFGGDTTKAKTLRSQRSAKTAPDMEAIKQLQATITQLRDQSGWDPRNWGSNKDETIQSMTESRNALLQGKSIEDVAAIFDKKLADIKGLHATSPGDAKDQAAPLQQQIGVLLKTLSQNPKEHRAVIKKLTQQKIGLMTLGGK